LASESAGGGEEKKRLSSAGTNSAAANRINVSNSGSGSYTTTCDPFGIEQA
jgi:hypothetical protein